MGVWSGEERWTLDKRRTCPEPAGGRREDADDGSRIEAHHEETSTGGGRGRSAAHGMRP